ncbi:uncharacterized protein LOC111089526 [Limulus polyphemus]|uniref:Uncharacterized protein LOC111089526 n=1 Tax=Limulus polyphemus TaxID=6850 RepID=A0ABM1TPV5_LIMPO|nr:uncharacterized protein LOC111089526 [Limulus polyphemus]
MVRLLCQCLQCRKLTFKDIFCHLRKLNDAKKDVELIEPELDDAQCSLREFHKKITDLQASHQLELWKTIKTLAHQLRCVKFDVKESIEPNNNTSFQSDYSPVTSESNSLATKSIPSVDQSLLPSYEEDMDKADHLTKGSETSISQACASQMSEKSVPVSSLASHSLGTILAVNSEQSKILKNENQACYNKLNSMLSAFEQQHQQLLTSVTDFDFNYLKKDNQHAVKDETQSCLD